MGKKPVIKLRVYKGNEMSYDANQKPKNENQLVTLVHDTVEWKNFLKNIKANQYCKIDIESALLVDKKKNEDGFFVETTSEYKDVEAIEKEVKKSFSEPEKVLTPEQKRIAELEAKIDLLMGNKTDSDIDDITPLRDKYKELTGNDADKRWKEAKLTEEIEKAEKAKK